MIFAKTTTLKIIDSRLTVGLLLALAVALAVFYIILVNNSVFNIVAREQALSQISDLQTELAGLETSYLTLSSHLTMPLALSRGFIDASQTAVYVKASESAGRFSFASNEL